MQTDASNRKVPKLASPKHYVVSIEALQRSELKAQIFKTSNAASLTQAVGTGRMFGIAEFNGGMENHAVADDASKCGDPSLVVVQIKAFDACNNAT